MNVICIEHVVNFNLFKNQESLLFVLPALFLRKAGDIE